MKTIPHNGHRIRRAAGAWFGRGTAFARVYCRDCRLMVVGMGAAMEKKAALDNAIQETMQAFDRSWPTCEGKRN